VEDRIGINSALPGAQSQELLKLRQQNIARGISCALPVFVKEARGALVEDVDGNVLIDFVSGIGVVNCGHTHPAVVEAIREQAGKYLHTCFMVASYEPYLRVAERLNQIVPGSFPKKSALFNSGAEAVENAVKLARRFTNKPAIVALDNAFHGRTLMAMTLTSKVKPYKFGFGPFAPEVYKIPSAYCYRCRFNLAYPSCDLACARYLEHFFSAECPAESVAAVIAEPVQGEGGFIAAPPDYFRVLHEICRRHNVLLIMDEIQTGFYRTGHRFASEYYQVEPDLMTTAKSVAGGLPLSALTGRAEIMDAAGPGEIGGTYGGNPVACAAALAVMDLTEREDFASMAQKTGEKVRARLLKLKQEHDFIGDVRGLGAMQAMELVKDQASKAPDSDRAKAIIARCHKKGLIVITAGIYSNVIRLLMPVNIPDEHLTLGLNILEEAVKEEQ
jgi:4-aminobutyrate aminotransferase/(S)-3-amino-2-methylpropionate transaminase